jgi:DNA-binding MltR family transcriptional regulator
LGDKKIQEGIKDKDIEDMYERLMSPLNNLFKMSLFFAIVQIGVVKDMVCKDIALFQEIWEQINEEQGEASLLDIRKYLQCHKDIHMGWINMHWGLPQVPNVLISLPHKIAFALDKVVEQKNVSLLLAQLIIASAPTMLSLETPSNFMATG